MLLLIKSCQESYRYSETCIKCTLVALSKNTGLFYRKYGKKCLELTSTRVHVIQGVFFIWGPLNTGFTVGCMILPYKLLWLTDVCYLFFPCFKLLIRAQDEQIDMVGHSVGVLKTMGKKIGDEIEEQNL